MLESVDGVDGLEKLIEVIARNCHGDGTEGWCDHRYDGVDGCIRTASSGSGNVLLKRVVHLEEG